MNIPFHDHKEKILRQVLRVRGRVTATVNVGKNRPPVDLAKLGEAGIDFSLFVARQALPDQAPARSDEMRQSPGALDGTGISHRGIVIAPLPLLKTKISKLRVTAN